MKTTTGGFSREELEEFRALQEEMLRLSQDYGAARLSAWSREIRDMTAACEDFGKDWQGSLEQMSRGAFAVFEEISAKGEAAAHLLSQSWQRSLAEMSAEVEAWGEHTRNIFDQVSRGWSEGGGGGGGWLSWLGFDFGLGGIFHHGGIVEAHRGMVVNPETLMEDERLAVVQTGEGILPRDAMVRLGEDTFEALRSGRFEMNPGRHGPDYQITIQVQSLDAAGVAGLDWDRLVQRHLLPALRRDLDRRW
jgi:hypothetical protein